MASPNMMPFGRFSDRNQPTGTHFQVDFSGGVNPMPPAHLIGEKEVASATNVDFAMMQGAITPRRGSTNISTLGSGNAIALFHNYNSDNTITVGNLYAEDNNGNWYRGTTTAPNIAPAMSIIASGMIFANPGASPMASMQGYTLIPGGTKNLKDDGTNVTEWIKQVPGTCSVTVNTLTALMFTGTFGVPDGTLISSNSATCTFASTNAATANAVMTLGSATSMLLNGINTIGSYGVQFINIAFSDPTQVQQISFDFSINDATFANFYHYSLNPQAGGALVTRGQSELLINAQTAIGSGTLPPGVQDRQDIWSQIAEYNFQPLSFIPSITNVSSPWAVPIGQFGLVAQNIVGSAGIAPWGTISAIRIGVSLTGTCTITVGAPALYGAVNFPLMDVQTGYTYWQTFATLDTLGNKRDEGAPGPPVGPFLAQNANATIVNTSTATGTQHGITHRITYRQGGFLQAPYAISTITYSTTTFTDTLSDIDALTANFPLNATLMAPNQFPGNVLAMAAPVSDRVFISDENKLRWNKVGYVGGFDLNGFQEVSAVGDDIMGLMPYGTGVVIVNRNSVYEFYGSDLEDANYTLSRSSCKRGSLASKTIIKTPHGIPLLNLDGLTWYMPGYGIDQEIPWFKEKYGDIFKSSVPKWKGNRVPQLAQGSIHTSIAAWRNAQLLLGLPTGTNSNPDTLFILDFNKQQCWWYTYPFQFASIMADDRVQDILVGDLSGNIQRIETDLLTDSGTAIQWSANSRVWTVPSNSCLENLSVESQGTNITASAVYDGSAATVITTMTNALRQWNTPPLNGTFENSVQLNFAGSNGTGTLDALYGMAFDMLVEPVKVRYHRTGYDQQNHDADKLWDVQYYDIDISCTTGSSASLVTAVTFVDATAVMTYTWTGTTGGRKTFEIAFPAETYGRVAYTTYTSTDTTVFFKPWSNDYQTRKEPAKVAYWRSDIISDPEREIKVFKPEINCNGGTVLATVVMNDIQISTHTITGTDRKQYTFSVPVEQYSRTTWAIYNGVAGNVFKVYTTEWDGLPEPPRVTLWRHGPNPFPASNYLKTWSPLLDPINGTVTGSLIINDVMVQTNTFTGNRRQWFTVGLDLDLTALGTPYHHLSTASRWEVVYSSPSQFKHYDTKMESESKPFEKRSWSYSYRKVGGASQIDMARFWSIFCSVEAPATGTYWWDIDGENFSTGTITMSKQEWLDRIPFPPGARGREFQFRLLAPALVKVRVVNVDLNQEGVKALTRRGEIGTPNSGGSSQYGAAVQGPGGEQ